MKAIYEALARIQSELKVPKNQHNSFGNYDYRSAEDILEALKPFLKREKMLLTMSDEIVNIGSKNYIKSTVDIFDPDFPDQRVAVVGFARESESQKGMADAQLTGSTSSYAKKYALGNLLLIDDTKDDDTRDNTKTASPKSPAQASMNVAKSPKAVNLIGECLASKWNEEKKRTEYEVETEDNVLHIVFVKKPQITLTERQQVKVVGWWESEFNGKMYEFAKDIKPLVIVDDEEIPF